MKTLLFSLLAVALFAACAPGGQPSAGQVQTAQQLAGQYQGTVPCADCEGIEYILTLNSDFTYLGAMVYRGKGTNPIPLTGKWSFVADNKIKLEMAPPAGLHQFEIGTNQIILLDPQGQRVSGEFADQYILWREGFAPPAPSRAGTAAPDDWETQRAAGIDFFGLGTEPFWALELDFDNLLTFYSMNGDTVKTPSVAGRMEDGTLTYEAPTTAGNFKIDIRRESCSDGMSDRQYDYSVVVNAKGQTYKGCGVLLAGSLGSYWTLQRLNGTEPDAKRFAKGLPVLQIDVLAGKYNGTDGCNNLHGTVRREGAKINFADPVMTRMACSGDAHQQYLTALLAVTDYKLADKQLTLFTNGQPTLVFALR